MLVSVFLPATWVRYMQQIIKMQNTHLYEKFLSLFVFRFCVAIFLKVFNVWSKKCFLSLFRKNIVREFLISLIFQIARQSNKSTSFNVKGKLLD